MLPKFLLSTVAIAALALCSIVDARTCRRDALDTRACRRSTPSFAPASASPLHHSLAPPASLHKRTAATIITACTVPGTVAVTFDDGPSLWTADLLDYLKDRNIQVTFFVNGQNYNLITDPQFAAVVKRAHDEGHQIGSHTWAHADLSAVGVDIASQMTMLDDALVKIIGGRPVYMRPPYGNTSPEALAYLGEHEYKVINWNIDTNDWMHPSDYKTDIESYEAALNQNGAETKGYIALEHDAEQLTAQVFSHLAIEYVLSKNMKVVPVGTCLGDTNGWYRQ